MQAVPAIEAQHKTIEGLDAQLISGMGVGAKVPNSTEDLTLRRAILIGMTMHRPENAQEAMRVFEMSVAIRTAEGNARLDLSDWNMIKKIVEKNDVGWGAVTLGQVCRAFV